MPLYINHLGISEANWGLLATFMAAGMVIFEWVWGILSDRGNRLIYTSVSLFVMTLIFPLYTNKEFIQFFFVF
jgi:MFS family permease